VDPFLLRFLPAMALWTVVVTSFTPFANVYLSRNLHVPLLRIGLIFSAAQLVQLCVTLLTPMLFRSLGLVNGIVVTQLLTAVALGCLAGTQSAQLAVPLYIGFFGLQWMSAPGMYNLLMSRVSEEEQSTASSTTLFCNALVGAGSTAGAGILFTKFGYPHMLAGIAAVAVVAAMLFRKLAGDSQHASSVSGIA
jgi:predicted MFS family arabinose efflux permease